MEPIAGLRAPGQARAERNNVIPFRVRKGSERDSRGERRPGAPATGSFWSPSGGRGTFTGTYRIFRVTSFEGELVTVGVMSGVLRNGDGSYLGLGGRRCAAAVRVAHDPQALELVVGPLEIDLLGFLVTVDELAVELPEDGGEGTVHPGLPRVLRLLRPG
jgi:hypothetical protein